MIHRNYFSKREMRRHVLAALYIGLFSGAYFFYFIQRYFF